MERLASNGGFQTLDLSGPEFESEPARGQAAENDDVSMVFLPFKAGDHQPLELVPDLSAGTAGSAIPAAAPRPAARYRGGSILPAEAPPIVNATPPPPTAAPAPARRKCGTRARASRGRAVRARGSRRSNAASRAAPSGDPDPGDEPPKSRPSLPQGAMA